MQNETFGSRLLRRRKELNLSQAALGKLAKVAHVTISQWERDETQPAGKRLFALAKVLQCEPAWLMFGDSDKKPEVFDTSLADQVKNDLSPVHQELLDLFDSLPSSEQEAQLNELRARVENFNRLFEELLQARKKNRKK